MCLSQPGALAQLQELSSLHLVLALKSRCIFCLISLSWRLHCPGTPATDVNAWGVVMIYARTRYPAVNSTNTATPRRKRVSPQKKHCSLLFYSYCCRTGDRNGFFPHISLNEWDSFEVSAAPRSCGWRGEMESHTQITGPELRFGAHPRSNSENVRVFCRLLNSWMLQSSEAVKHSRQRSGKDVRSLLKKYQGCIKKVVVSRCGSNYSLLQHDGFLGLGQIDIHLSFPCEFYLRQSICKNYTLSFPIQTRMKNL